MKPWHKLPSYSQFLVKVYAIKAVKYPGIVSYETLAKFSTHSITNGQPLSNTHEKRVTYGKSLYQEIR